jgi:hypothetical protein
MSGAPSFLLDFRVNALSIIADPQAKQVIIVSNLGLDQVCTCVLERISQHLAADPVNLVLEDRSQGLSLALHNHAENRRIAVRVLRARQFLTGGG